MYQILLLVFLLFGLTTIAQNRITPYDFPVKPGTEEWKKLKSGKEMAEACNIPPSIITSLTTGALVKTCLSYPLLNEVFYANNLPEGLEGLIKNFNGFNELLKRKDGAKELLKIYKIKNPKEVNESASEVEKGLFTLEFIYIELLLSYPQMLDNLSSKERLELAKDAIAKYDAKKDKAHIFGEFGLTTSVFVVGRILKAENKLSEVVKKLPQKEIEAFLTTIRYSDPSIISAIYTVGKSL